MDNRNLWVALVKSEAKSEIYCPPDLKVSIDDLFSTLKTLIQENNIPADIEMFNVTWDYTGLEQKRFIVKYTGDEIKSNKEIIQFLIGLDHFGNYTYIEEKVFLDPPKLPKFPSALKEPKERPSVNILGAIVAFICYIIPGVLYLMSVQNKQKNYDENIGPYNEVAKKEQKAWDNTWKDWETNVLSAAYLGSTNDVFGRFVKAISSLVKMAIKSLFEDKKAEIKDRVEKEFTEQQLKDELEKRKSEFK
jgi:gas vesicle protein